MLFPHCSFIGFNVGLDLQIGKYSCKLLGQVRNASFPLLQLRLSQGAEALRLCCSCSCASLRRIMHA